MNSSASPIIREIEIPSDLSAVRTLQNEIEEHLLTCRYGEFDIFGIKMALEEALVNAIKHGNQLDPEKKVKVCFSISAHYFEISIMDEGPGFDPEDVPDPTAPENLERPCGRGLLLMRSFMNQVDFIGKGNAIRMCKHRELNENGGS